MSLQTQNLYQRFGLRNYEEIRSGESRPNSLAEREVLPQQLLLLVQTSAAAGRPWWPTEEEEELFHLPRPSKHLKNCWMKTK